MTLLLFKVLISVLQCVLGKNKERRTGPKKHFVYPLIINKMDDSQSLSYRTCVLGLST